MVNSVARKNWTVLYYLNGRNNLSPSAAEFAGELKRHCSGNDDVSVVVELGTKKSVSRGALENRRSVLQAMDPNTDMGDAASLADFVAWGMKQYPADHYAVVLWGHGMGFPGSMPDDGSGHCIRNNELADVLKNTQDAKGHGVDLLDFGACLMGQAEVQYALKDAVPCVVASEETQTGVAFALPGLPDGVVEPQVIKDLKAAIQQKGDVAPQDLARLYVFEAKHQGAARMFAPTLSAVDTSKMKAVAGAVDSMSSGLLDAISHNPSLVDHVRDDVAATTRFCNDKQTMRPYSDYRDLGDLAARIASNDAYPEAVRQAATQVGASVHDAVFAEEHKAHEMNGANIASATGLTIYAPLDLGTLANLEHRYESTEFAADTHWPDLLTAISQPEGSHKIADAAGDAGREVVQVGATLGSLVLSPIGMVERFHAHDMSIDEKLAETRR